MKKGILYNNMDCLDVLETLEDKTFSLIYLDIPYVIGKCSKRIMYDESRANPVSALRREKGCKLQDLSSDEIQSFIEECEIDRKKEYEKYLFKIVQNCYRVLTDNGIIIYREVYGDYDYVDLKYVLGNLFSMFGKRVLEHVGMKPHFDLIYFYSKKSSVRFPDMYELQPLERYPYEDEKGRYRLLAIECRRDETNFFKWNGYCPGEGKGWRYNRKTLNDLNKKGYIEEVKNMYGDIFPKLKYYREEHPVPVSGIWKDREFFERVFNTFTSINDKVLCIYESLGFAYSAEKKHLTWFSVYPRDKVKAWVVSDGKVEETKKGSFLGKGLIEGKYELVESLQNHKLRIYNENIPSMIEHIKEKNEFFQNEIKKYELDERLPINVGNTTDEILVYYIDEYIRRNDISLSEFENRTGVLRQTVYEMKDGISGKRKSKKRKKNVILRVAVFTGMMYPEINCALNLSNLSFEEDVADDTIINWLYDKKRNIDELNELIIKNCEKENWPEEKINKRLFLTKKEGGKKEKTLSISR